MIYISPMKNELFSYFAGLFDGEGCIQIVKYTSHWSRRKTKVYGLQVTVNMSSISPQKLLKKHFGGSIINRKGAIPNHRDTHVWQIWGAKAMFFLKAIYPYSMIKKEQIENAIEFQEHLEVFQKVWPKIKGKSTNTLPSEVIEYREKLFKKAKDLKKDFH
jgi:hypothetical protein